MLGEHQAMDMGVMRIITSWGVSRIPIYRGARRNNIIGLLLVKDHITLDPDDAVPIEQARFPSGSPQIATRFPSGFIGFLRSSF